MSRPLIAPLLFVLFLAAAPGSNGQGWLDTARHHAHPSQGEVHYIADFDQNGVDDFVWFEGVPGTPTNWEGFRVLFNDGTGDFPGSGPLVSFPMNGHRFRPLREEGIRRAPDVTGDGRSDVIVVEEQDYQLDLFLHVHPSIGSGPFGPPLAIPLSGKVRGVALGQVDGDAALELAIVETVGFTWVVAWYDLVGGAFVKSAALTIPFPGPFGSPPPTRLVALDLDADGDDDLVLGESSGTNLLVFPTVAGAPTAHSTVTLPVAPSTRLVPFVCDLVGGGAQDLVVSAWKSSSNDITLIPILNGGGSLSIGTPTVIVPPVGQSVSSNGFTFVDWDEDGDLDGLNYPWQEPAGTTEAIVAFFENDGANRFLGPVAKAETVHVGSALVGTSDLDQDGHQDAVLPHGALFGRGRFESSLVAVTDYFYGASPIAVFDHEGDGDQDLFYEWGNVRLNDGTGAFPTMVDTPPAPPGTNKRKVASVGDFTGDGRVDFLVGIETPPVGFPPFPSFQEMRLYADDGIGGFVDLGPATTAHMEPYQRFMNIAYDLDQDGDLDVLDGIPGGYFPNAGTGTFLPFVPLFGASNEPCAVGDLDADGDPDVVTLEQWTTIKVWTNQGGLAFVPMILHSDIGAIDPGSLALTDHDGDGDLDLAFTTKWDEGIHLYANDGAGNLTPGGDLYAGVSSGTDPAMRFVSFDDVDGDGVRDVLAGGTGYASDTPRAVFLFRGLPGGGFESSRAYAGGTMGPAADVDGDGDQDLTGRVTVRSRRHDGPTDGAIRQFGVGAAGNGGAIPVLGAAGPLRSGSTTAELRLRRASGGAPVVLLYGLNEAAIPNSPVFGATLYVGPPISSVTVFAGGFPGVPGAGTLDVNLAPVLPIVAGVTLVIQVAVLDGGAAHGIATSNGLALTFGT